MNIVLLSGGSGKRLWPLSNDVRSKQFIKLFKNENNEYESMIQRMYNGIKKVDKDANITIATAKSQVSSIYNQLSKDVDVSLEPCRRDTFPAILLAVSYLYDVKRVSKDENVIICPVDPYVDEDYFKALHELYRYSSTNDANITLMGIDPTYPSEKYGYIIPFEKGEYSHVKTFKEKPDEETAKKYIEQGALWNGGIFAFSIDYLLNIGHKLINFTDYYDLLDKYESLEKISFDYAVLEKEQNIDVYSFKGNWKDLGTWNVLSETIDDKIIGNGKMDPTCKNTSIINELDVPVLCMGLEDVIVAASPDGILVSTKSASSKMKPYVESIDNTIHYAEKSWGSYRVIDVQDESMTLLVTLKPGNKMSYHTHEYRDEVWNVISGVGEAIIDDERRIVKPGDVIKIKRGVYHTVIAGSTDLKIVEVQLGKDISVDDKTKAKVLEKENEKRM